MKIDIGLIGFGTVGSGVVKLLKENHGLIEKRTGINLCLGKIVDKNITSSREAEVDSNVLTTDVNTLWADPDIKIVVELIGGEEPARSYIIKALKSGKHVVTANKLVLAKYGEEIYSIARENNVQIHYEASVAGGIPLINALKEGLVANKIKAMFGIINGTTNYILTKMSEECRTFEQALSDARRKGYAEANPEFDIKGVDACQKIAILSQLAFGSKISTGDIYTEGINEVTLEDIKFVRKFGYVIKLLAIAKNTPDGLEVRVHPTLLAVKHPLASVRDEYNAICIEGDALGTVMFYGKGAGQMPTASSVVSDIVRICSSIKDNKLSPGPFWGNNKIKPIEDVSSRYYLRFPIIDRSGIVGKIGTILGNHDISITSVIASLVENHKENGNVEVLTREIKEINVRSALKEIEDLNILRDKSKLIRIEDD